MTPETLILRRRDVKRLLPLDDCIASVETAFRMQGEGRTQPPAMMGMHVGDGGFHVKAAVLHLSRPYFAAKVNANFPANRAQFGLPTIQGVLALFDARSGSILALMDSTEITVLRTGAATALAAKHLARQGAGVLTICGCGNQGAVSARAITRVHAVHSIYLWDTAAACAESLAHELVGAAKTVEAVTDWRAALRRSDIIATCTTSSEPFLRKDDVRPGTFVAAVGADSSGKQEIDPELMALAAVVTDMTSQCAAIGDLHHAITAGAMSAADVRAQLGDVLTGRLAGRRDEHEIVIFDSTGIALQDVAAAALVYERALESGHGATIQLG
jgi:alanine dehydrogenase